MKELRAYRFEIVLGTLIFLVLGPLMATILGVDIRFLNLFGLSLLSLASLIMAIRKVPRLFTGILGFLTLLLVWSEFLYSNEPTISKLRMWSMLGLYSSLAYLLVRNFLDTPEVSPRMISGAVSGFILIGFLGGVLFELLNSFQEGAFLIKSNSGGYDLYYYSFISMMTVGYGDIIPLSGAAKSLTVILSLSGQLYMTIGIASFVGKYLNSFSKTT
ncbi:potassium channel family protein [Neolewinella persica]|uniref:potassium channel family protein n=1 Tax=Neolewinella persica TaxID=70998 RepID=UPI000369A345|nr:potassium channel family protein [Neolewinella persica]